MKSFASISHQLLATRIIYKKYFNFKAFGVTPSSVTMILDRFNPIIYDDRVARN